MPLQELTPLQALSFDEQLDLFASCNYAAIDTEGYSRNVYGISVAAKGLFSGLYFPLDHIGENLSVAQTKKLYSIIERLDTAVFHNAAHDLEVLESIDLEYKGWFHDTMLMAHWVNEEEFSYDLDNLTRVYKVSRKQMPKSMKMIIDSDGWRAVPLRLMTAYSGQDAFSTLELDEKITEKFWTQFDRELWATEQKFIRENMMPMMRRGIRIDTDYALTEYMRGDQIMKQLKEELGINPSSSKDLQKLFIEDLGLPVVKHTKACEKCFPKQKFIRKQGVHTHDAKPSFDKEAMEKYDVLLANNEDPRAKQILTFKGWQKTCSSNYLPYMKLVDENHYLHPGYKLHGTRTGRLSCAEPNLQQIPKHSDKDWNGGLKQVFIPTEGFDNWTVDYSQLQFRMTVAYAVAFARENGFECFAEEDLLAAFNDFERDVFTEMTGSLAMKRDDVKTMVYLILFGGGGQRAADAFRISLEMGQSRVNDFYEQFPNIKRVSKSAESNARRNGHVRYWTGRRRHFGHGAPFYRAFNAVIQGGEAEIMKRAMIYATEEMDESEARFVLQIHDELVPEIKKGMEDKYLPIVQNAMARAGQDFSDFIGVDIKFKTDVKPWGKK